ncbi:TonB family protein [Flavobacterium ardleyense]|uniref:TonB family protein n=1 Tax=Flavobacterium ardleyense TaxID=2038737 RepID=A0ABW5Z8W1_9FLAO
MTTFLIYSLQTIVLQLLFLAVFEILFKKETFFKANRFYLIGALILSLGLPLIQIPVDVIVHEQGVYQLKEIVITKNVSEIYLKNGLENYSSVFLLYLIGVFVFSFLFIYKLGKLLTYIISAKKSDQNKGNVFFISNPNQAFSFFNKVFIGADNQNIDVILKHELVHAKQLHSVDVLFMEILKIIFWFNPVLYLYHNRIVALHEFEADFKSADSDRKKYFEVLLCEVLNCHCVSFTNNFYNQSLIKKRIIMLQKSKSKRQGVVKYLLAIPVIVLSMTVFSTTVVAQETKKLEKKVEKAVEKKSNTDQSKIEAVSKTQVAPVYDNERVERIKAADEKVSQHLAKELPLAVVEEIPRFKGCEGVAKADQIDCFQKQMTNHIRQHFNYPSEALENNVQGRVQVEYVINTEGNVELLRVKGPENTQALEEEARRIIKLLPQFIPGKQKGKAIAVRHVVPITFKMQ